jgi:hypothetical protein
LIERVSAALLEARSKFPDGLTRALLTIPEYATPSIVAATVPRFADPPEPPDPPDPELFPLGPVGLSPPHAMVRVVSSRRRVCTAERSKLIRRA